jgi:hypothetical protein
MLEPVAHKSQYSRWKAIVATFVFATLLVGGFALSNPPASAGPNIWTTGVGASLGDVGVSDFVVGPDGWLVSSRKGSTPTLSLYRSSDKGTTWALAYNHSTDPGADSITGMGMSGDNIFISLFPTYETHGGSPDYFGDPAIIRSTDGGATWGPSVLNVHGADVRFTFGGAAGQTIYAAAAPHILSTSTLYSWYGMPGGLYRSTDAGATWVTLTVGIVLRNVLVDPADNNHLWAAGNGGLAESTDAGATWTVNPKVGGLVLNDAGSSTTLYAYGIIPPVKPHDSVTPTTGPLYKSTDAGRTWRPVSITGAPAGYSVNLYTVAGKGHLVVSWQSRPNGEGEALPWQISESLDGGLTWRDLNSTGLNLYSSSGLSLAIDEQSGALLSIGNVNNSSKLVSYTTVAEQPDPAFNALWQRQDAPVQKGIDPRSWTWGPQPFATMREPLEGVPGNSRIVQYYDKSRMEVNDPTADRNSPWFVTNGLLTVEMVAGRVQTGLNKWEPRSPADIPVAGDAGPGEHTNTSAPTYASFRNVASYEGDKNKSPDRVGSTVKESIDRTGVVGNDVPPADQINPVKLAQYDAGSGHNIAAPFWEYLNREGKVLENGSYVQKPIFGDWVFVMGHPISEPYWTRISVSVNGHATSPWTMVQLFERRVLTYTPDNPPEWQVEMGNVGLHYYLWRYGDSR